MPMVKTCMATRNGTEIHGLAQGLAIVAIENDLGLESEVVGIEIDLAVVNVDVAADEVIVRIGVAAVVDAIATVVITCEEIVLMTRM